MDRKVATSTWCDLDARRRPTATTLSRPPGTAMPPRNHAQKYADYDYVPARMLEDGMEIVNCGETVTVVGVQCLAREGAPHMVRVELEGHSVRGTYSTGFQKVDLLPRTAESAARHTLRRDRLAAAGDAADLAAFLEWDAKSPAAVPKPRGMRIRRAP